MTRLLSWNILQGGGRRSDDVIKTIAAYKPDIVALQEFRPGKHGDKLMAGLKKLGLVHNFTGDGEAGQNTLFIGSSLPFDAGDFVEDREGLCHIVEASFESLDLSLINLHFPQKDAQKPLFDLLEADTPSLLRSPTVIVGDMNCGIPFEDSDSKTFQNTKRFQRLKEMGWIDSWRSRNQKAKEFTWSSVRTGNRFRYDHVFASAEFDRQITNIAYDHAVRDTRISDHSLILVDF